MAFEAVGSKRPVLIAPDRTDGSAAREPLRYPLPGLKSDGAVRSVRRVAGPVFCRRGRRQMEMPRIESPCTKVCVINPTTRLCEGCGRTIDEIAAWATLANDDRRRIIAELPNRRGR